MIVRIWRGWAPPATAEDYQRHYDTEVADHLRKVAGCQGARLLRRQDGDEIKFTSLTFFTDLAAVQAFAGENYEKAVLEDAARQALSHWDDQVEHHEVAVDLSF